MPDKEVRRIGSSSELPRRIGPSSDLPIRRTDRKHQTGRAPVSINFDDYSAEHVTVQDYQIFRLAINNLNEQYSKPVKRWVEDIKKNLKTLDRPHKTRLI